MFGETTIFHVKIWNHPIETTILKWMFQVPGMNKTFWWFLMKNKLTGPLVGNKMSEAKMAMMGMLLFFLIP